MKIFSFGLNLEPKKYSYESEDFKKLVNKFSPKKKNPFFAEIIDSGIEAADLVAADKAKVVDLCLDDLEKIEQRLARAENSQEKEALRQAQKLLESEKALSCCQIEESSLALLKELQLVSLKPLIVKDNFDASAENINKLIGEALEAAGRVLFFTASEKEVKAWDLKKGKTILEAAGKIHSDLMRGFIRAEIINSKHLDSFFNMAEAKNKGMVEVVGKDYLVEPGDIVHIKFSV